MTVEEIEIAIVTKLQQDIEEVEILAYPDDVQNYDMIHPNAAVLVHYGGANYTAPNSIQQTKMLQYDITVISRNLRSNTGAYSLMDKVRQSITGDFFIGYSRFYCFSEKFIDVIDNLWYYELTFLLPDVIIQGE